MGIRATVVKSQEGARKSTDQSVGFDFVLLEPESVTNYTLDRENFD